MRAEQEADYEWPITAATALCECGCGEPAPLAKNTDRSRGYVKGQPRRFVYGHQSKHLAQDVAGRFFPRVNRTESCWLWTGTLNNYGYGTFAIGPRRVMAHRWSYEHHVGPIPEGLVLDHLCRVRNCVNPDHLEPVTNAENIARGLNGQANRTHCANGHEYTPENTRIIASPSAPTPYRQCRTCHNARCKARGESVSAGDLLAQLEATRKADQEARDRLAFGGRG